MGPDMRCRPESQSAWLVLDGIEPRRIRVLRFVVTQPGFSFAGGYAMDLQIVTIAAKCPAIKKACDIISRDHLALTNQRTGGSIELRIVYNDEGCPVSVEDMGREKHLFKKGIPAQ